MSTATVYTSKDTFVDQGSSGSNYGDWTSMKLGGWSSDLDTILMEFDITSAPSTSLVSSVSLRLYKTFTDTVAGAFNRITGSWTESGVTWNNQPAVTATNQYNYSVGGSGWGYYDITNLYKDAKNLGNALGVRIYTTTSNTVYINAKEHSSGNYPYIYITYAASDHYHVKVGGNDSLDGLSWANAWATVNKAATTVADGSTVHIGFGDYTAEPASNKIAPQNIGATGITYHCETATTGGGTGTVSVEQNT